MSDGELFSSFRLCLSLSLHLVSEDGFERERNKFVASTLVELVLELDPMETESVQETLEGIHAHQYSEGEGEECKEAEPHDGTTSTGGVNSVSNSHDVFKEHTSQLRVSK